jgi:pimeloyl-ACP methyl ester carboxylesterase
MTSTSGSGAAPDRGQDTRRTRRRRFVGVGVVVLVVVGILARPVGQQFVAIVTVAEGLGMDVSRPFAPAIDRERSTIGDLEVDRYAPDGGHTDTVRRPAIVLVPGASPAGRDDRRVVAIATALSRADRVVIVPELEVYGEDLVPADIDRIVDITAVAAADHEAVVLAGLSFGGSLGLIAAADPRLEGRVGLVATFGAYADLAGVIQAATTGVSLVGDQRIAWEPDPRAEEVIGDQVLALLPTADRAAVAAALAGDRTAAALRPELRAVHELLTAEDPDQTMSALEAGPEVVKERIAEVSPVRVAQDLEVDIVAMHTVDDPVIPYGELARLRAAYPQTRTLTLTTFDHVGIGENEQGWWVTIRDLWKTTRFVRHILAVN